MKCIYGGLGLEMNAIYYLLEYFGKNPVSGTCFYAQYRRKWLCGHLLTQTRRWMIWYFDFRKYCWVIIVLDILKNGVILVHTVLTCSLWLTILHTVEFLPVLQLRILIFSWLWRDPKVWRYFNGVLNMHHLVIETCVLLEGKKTSLVSYFVFWV